MALDLAKAWFSDSPSPSYRPQTRHLRVRSRNVFHPSGKPSASLHACQGTANAPHLLDHLLGRDGMLSCSSKQEEDPLSLAALCADVFCLLEVQQLQPNILLHPLEARKPHQGLMALLTCLPSNPTGRRLRNNLHSTTKGVTVIGLAAVLLLARSPKSLSRFCSNQM